MILLMIRSKSVRLDIADLTIEKNNCVYEFLRQLSSTNRKGGDMMHMCTFKQLVLMNTYTNIVVVERGDQRWRKGPVQTQKGDIVNCILD